MPGTPQSRQLDALVRMACRVVRADGGCVSLVTSDGTPLRLFATDQVAAGIEDLEFTLGEGPVAASTGGPVLVDDLTAPPASRAQDWPVFRTEAAATGARALFVLPVRIASFQLGTLSLYRRSPGPLTLPALRAALAMSDAVAAWALGTLPEAALPQLLAPASMVVQQAAGVTMAQLGSDLDEAMVRLRATAFAEEWPIVDLATEVVSGRRNLSHEIG